jgi:TonB family protein
MTRLSLALVLVLATPAALAAQQPAAADTSRVYEPSELSTMPRLVNLDELRAALQAGYPPELRESRVEGTVAVSLVVNRYGRPEEISVVQSTHPAFDSVTLATAAGLRFTAAMADGRPVRTRVQIPVQWRLPADAPTADSGAVASAAPPAQAPPAPPSARPDCESTYSLRDVQGPPQPLNLIEFRRMMLTHYPASMRGAGRGVVQVRFRVGCDGVPSRIAITQSSHLAFNAPTVDLVPMLRFSPARMNGQPVAVWVELPIEWSSR